MTPSQRVALYVTTVLTGFYGGIGFFDFMSFLPTLARLPAEHLIPFWRLIDGYMGTRMPVFGPLMLLSLVVTLLMVRRQWRKAPFWLVAAALAVLIADLIVALNENIPVNQAIQDRRAVYTPAQIEAFRATMLRAFTIRSFLMILCFLLVSGVWVFSTHSQPVRKQTRV